MTKISNKIIYPIEDDESPIGLGDYLIGSKDETGITRNFSINGLISLTLSMITGEVKTWITVEVSEDENFIQDNRMIGASSIDIIAGQNMIYKTANENVDFDSDTGTVLNFGVISGERYVIFFSKGDVPPSDINYFDVEFDVEFG